MVSGTWDAQWLYIAGPVLGALAGAMLYVVIRTTPREVTS
ncbi:MAG: hypothetical protein ACOC9Y_07295 [Chloroflexota bacterium]